MRRPRPTTAERIARYFEGREVERREPTRRWKTTEALIDQLREIVNGFDGSMSTRQCFYQAVSRGFVENTGPSYDRVQRLLVAMRRDGEIEQDKICDRSRSKHHRTGFDGIADVMKTVRTQDRRDLWAEQEIVPMIASEKQALEGVIGQVVDEFGAPLYTLRGFVSESFAYEWASEIRELTDEGKRVVVTYLGDADPSGLEIEFDAQQKLLRHSAEFEWVRGGLLFEDFSKFDLVHVPVKHTDTRARRYLEAFGDVAAELDALPPAVLHDRVRHAIEQHIDAEAWERLRTAERAEQESLRLIADNWQGALRGAAGGSP